jgi:glucosylglycerate synthase
VAAGQEDDADPSNRIYGLRMHQYLLPDSIRSKLEGRGPVDILIGVPSFNNSRTIGHVVQAILAGLAKYYPDKQAIVVNSDGGSTDGTPDRVLSAEIEYHRLLIVSHPLRPVHRLTTPYHGIPGKGSAFRTIFQIIETLQAKYCAVFDSDLRSITPEWIHLLLQPQISQSYDFVAPYYLRHKYDGTITNSIIYPLTRALYGKRVRQPIGGDFGFSGRLAAHYLKQDVWESDVARYGIDIWMTTTAITGGFPICQSFLGAKIHDAKDPGADLSAMFHQVLGSVFSLMEKHRKIWAQEKQSEEVPVFGLPFDVGLEPLTVDIPRMRGQFRQALRDLGGLWRQIISEENYGAVSDLGSQADDRFHFSDENWVRVVCDFAAAYHHRKIHREHLLRSFTPMYLGRTASFFSEVEHASSHQVENRIESLCQVYEESKTYLMNQWNRS